MRLWVLPILFAFLSACNTADNVAPPEDLKEITTELQTSRIWRQDTGAGSARHFLRLMGYLENNKIVVADAKGVVSALNRENGSVEWTRATRQSISAGVSGGDGIVVIGSIEGKLTALSMESGDQRWESTLSSEVMNLSRVESNRLVARTNDGYLYGIDASSGKTVWQYNYTVPALSLRTVGAPVIERGVVVSGLDDGHLVALSLDEGKLIWNKTIASGRGRNEIDRMVDIDGKISIDNDVVYVAGYQGRVAAVNLDNGRFLWVRDGSSVQGLALNDQALFYTDQDGTLWALDRRSGATLWKQDALLHRELSAPVAFNEQLLVADFKGYLHWLSTDDGHFVGRDKMSHSATWLSEPLDDQIVYILTRSGELSAWRNQ